MKVLITGGAGFIGSHLADALVKRGDDVLVIDNYSTGRRDNLKPHPKLEVKEASITDPRCVQDAFSTLKPDVVVHAAASYKDPENWMEDSDTNARGSAIVAQQAKKAGVQRIIYFNTALCYGLKPLEQPISLRHPINPSGSSYAITKTAGEQFIALSGIDYVSFRLANAYGPRNLSGPLPTFFHRLSNNKPCFVMDTRRDFIYVADLVNCVVKAVDGLGRAGAYHISSGTDYAIKELFDATIESMHIKLDKPVDVRPRGDDDAATILLDPTETKRDFNWSVTTSLRTGVQAAIAYYKEFGITQTYTHLHQPDVKK